MFVVHSAWKIVVAARLKETMCLVADAVGLLGHEVNHVTTGVEALVAARSEETIGLILEADLPFEAGDTRSWRGTSQTLDRLAKQAGGDTVPAVVMLNDEPDRDFGEIGALISWVASGSIVDFLLRPSLERPWTGSPENMLRLAGCFPMSRRLASPETWWTRRVWDSADRSTKAALTQIEQFYRDSWELNDRSRAAEAAAERDDMVALAVRKHSDAMALAHKHGKRLAKTEKQRESRQHRPAQSQ